MTRIFSLLFRMGKFPRPPSAGIEGRGGDGSVAVAEPRLFYQSKIALVLRRLQSEGMDRSLQRLNMMMQAAPDLADHVDWDHWFPGLSARVDGAPESMLRPWADVRAMRKERADPQQGASLAPAEEDPYASLNPLLDQLTAIQK